MLLRKIAEDYEEKYLAPYASKSYESRGRKRVEELDPNRTCFQRDRDRIFFSNSFRKLQYKTQVFVIREGEAYRNRYLHTMQVALHARAIARLLRANEDLCEAIAYAHDIGHAPFGHAGEEELKLISKEKGNFEFEHNSQSLRVVTLLEEKNGEEGLNLCFETQEGIARHETFTDSPKGIPKEFLQYKSPSIEAQIVNIADEIAFCVHDLYDALKARFFSKEKYALLRSIKIWKESEGYVGRLTHLLINDVLKNSIKSLGNINTVDEVRKCKILLSFSYEMENALKELRYFLFNELYKSPTVRIMDKKGKKIIRDLFNEFWKEPQLLKEKLRKKLENADKARVIVDYLASLSDIDAINLHKKHCDPYQRLTINFDKLI